MAEQGERTDGEVEWRACFCVEEAIFLPFIAGDDGLVGALVESCSSGGELGSDLRFGVKHVGFENEGLRSGRAEAALSRFCW